MWSWIPNTFRENKLILSALSWLLLSLLLSCKTCYMRASLSNASLTWLWPPWWIMDTSTQLNTQRAYRTVQAPVLSVISRSISKYLLFVNLDQFYSRERSQKLHALLPNSPGVMKICVTSSSSVEAVWPLAVFCWYLAALEQIYSMFEQTQAFVSQVFFWISLDSYYLFLL